VSAAPPGAVRAVVFGASGQVGRCVLRQCRVEGGAVLAFTRGALPADDAGVHWAVARLPDAVPSLPSAEALLSLGPLDLFSRWLQDAVPPGRPHVVALGSMSARSKARSPLPAERELAARLRSAEAALLQRCAALGLRCTVLRPTMIYGVGSDRNVAALMRAAARWRVMPLPRSRGLRQPVHAEDLAAAVLAAARSGEADGKVIEIGGGERLPVSAMFARIHRRVPRRCLPLPLPAWLPRAVGPLATHWRPAAALARFDDDLVADNAEAERLLGVHPRGFEPPGP
jgi:nucleoside-diphosphate-sugar epimerase